MSGYAVQVSELTKSFRRTLGLRAFTAVDSISFDVRSGEILGFLGPNGAGKTTTIKCMLGLLRPTGGSVSLWGMRPASAEVRRRLGYVPENPDYEDSFTGMELMRMFARMRRLDDGRARMLALLSRVGLEGWEDARIRSLSKGMRQRLSLALCLQSDPDLLVMDEPTGGLDPLARKEFRDIILEENDRGATVFLSSHLLSEVETVCTRAVILARGEKVSEGSLEELMRSGDEHRITFSPPDDPDRTDERVVPEERLQEEIDSLRASGARVRLISPVYRTLEEVFLSATSNRGGSG